MGGWVTFGGGDVGVLLLNGLIVHPNRVPHGLDVFLVLFLLGEWVGGWVGG